MRNENFWSDDIQLAKVTRITPTVSAINDGVSMETHGQALMSWVSGEGYGSLFAVLNVFMFIRCILRYAHTHKTNIIYSFKQPINLFFYLYKKLLFSCKLNLLNLLSKNKRLYFVVTHSFVLILKGICGLNLRLFVSFNQEIEQKQLRHQTLIRRLWSCTMEGYREACSVCVTLYLKAFIHTKRI